MAALGFSINSENWTIKADVDNVNISEEMSKTALWKSIMSNESSSSLKTPPGDDENTHKSSSKK